MFDYDPSLLRLKLHYLLHGMGGSPIVPFGSLLGRRLGVTAASMGVVFALIPLVGLVVKPLLGGLADKYGVKKRLLMLTILSAMVHYSLLPLLPPLPSSSLPSLLRCSQSGEASLTLNTKDPCIPDRLATVYSNRTVQCSASCPSSPTPLSLLLQPGLPSTSSGSVLLPLLSGSSSCTAPQNCSIDCAGEEELVRLLTFHKDEDSSQLLLPQYWLFLLVILLASLSFGCGCTFQESICHEVLGAEGSARYGQQRLFASLGWGGMAAVSGWLVGRDSKAGLQDDYTSAVGLMVVCWGLDLLVVRGLAVPETRGVADNPWKEVGRLLSRPQTVAFLTWSTMVGFCFGSMGLHFWLLEDLAGEASDCREASQLKLLQGLCLSVNCLGEIPVFFLSGSLLSYLGSSWAMTGVLLAHSARLTYYSLIVTPWQVLPIELVQGVTFGLFFPTLVSGAAAVAPPGAHTTMTTLAFIMFDGVGSSLGGWASALLYQELGGSATYGVFGGISGAAALVNMVLQHYTRQDSTVQGKVAVC